VIKTGRSVSAVITANKTNKTKQIDLLGHTWS